MSTNSCLLLLTPATHTTASSGCQPGTDPEAVPGCKPPLWCVVSQHAATFLMHTPLQTHIWAAGEQE